MYESNYTYADAGNDPHANTWNNANTDGDTNANHNTNAEPDTDSNTYTAAAADGHRQGVTTFRLYIYWCLYVSCRQINQC